MLLRATAWHQDGRISATASENYTVLADELRKFSSNLPLLVLNTGREEVSAGVQDPAVSWKLAHKEPWFNNQVATLCFDGRRATFLLEKALPTEDGHGEPELECVFRRSIEPNAVFAPT